MKKAVVVFLNLFSLVCALPPAAVLLPPIGAGADAELLSSRLEAALVSSGRILVVDRKRLAALVDEQNLQQSDLLAPESAVKTGRLLGARYLITPTLSVSHGRSVLSISVVDVETGIVAASVADSSVDTRVGISVGNIGRSVAVLTHAMQYAASVPGDSGLRCPGPLLVLQPFHTSDTSLLAEMIEPAMQKISDALSERFHVYRILSPADTSGFFECTGPLIFARIVTYRTEAAQMGQSIGVCALELLNAPTLHGPAIGEKKLVIARGDQGWNAADRFVSATNALAQKVLNLP